ncbi:MAG: hypothetical protein JRE23_11020 [Deltaproteobacteria bacterium]|nr:hypothetical protein [Deltaproteobacteria bacterium]
MKRHSHICILLLAACFFGAVVCGPMNVYAEESSSYNIPEGVHIDMNEGLYKALSNSQIGTKTRTTDPSNLYLKMILKNQEEIIKKLNLLLEKKK